MFLRNLCLYNNKPTSQKTEFFGPAEDEHSSSKTMEGVCVLDALATLPDYTMSPTSVLQCHIAGGTSETAPRSPDRPRTLGNQHLKCSLRQGRESMRKVIEKQHDARHTNYPLFHLPLILCYSLSRQ
jgi:hypothetical protein